MATATANRSTRRASARATAKARAEVLHQMLVPSPWKRPDRDNGLVFHDIFCGAGGSSLGLTHAGFRLGVAANHWPTAIATHASNFRYAEHDCADLNNYDFRRWDPADVLWASPICTELSPAGGGKSKSAPKKRRVKPTAVNGQGELINLEVFGPIASEGYERTRATFWDVLRAAEVHNYKAIIVENVPDAAEKWDLFDTWLHGLRAKKYNYQIISVNTAHVGGPGNPHAGQWRDRMYVVATKEGIPLPDVEPRPIALCPSCGETVRGVQTWCDAARKRAILVGRYRRDPRSSYGQYWYRCPNTRCRGQRVEPYVKPASAHIDWEDLGDLIADRKEPLTANTVKRIEAGLIKFYLKPMLATVAGNTYERPGYLRAHPAGGAPMPTLTTTGTEALVTPMMVRVRGNRMESHAGADYTRSLRTDMGPMAALTTSNNDAVVTPPGAFYTMAYSAERGRTPDRMARSVDEPLGAMTTTNSHAVIQPPAFRVNTNHDDTRAHDLHGEPLPAQTTKIGDMMVAPPMTVPVGGTWATEPVNVAGEPMRTQMANEKGCEALVTPEAFMTILRNHMDASSIGEPVQTVTTGSGAGGGDQYLTVPPGAFHVQNYGGHAQPHQVVHSAGDPFGPITTKDHHALVVPEGLVVPYYTKGRASGTNGPLDAVTTRDRFAVVRPEDLDAMFRKVDLRELVEACRYRMLKPEESAAAQRFDSDYIITGNIGERTMQAGNAVSANVAQWLGEQVAAALCAYAGV